MNIAYNMDCLEYMKTLPDKYFDLAVVDPPYGGGADVEQFTENEKGAHFVGRGRSKRYAEIRGGGVLNGTHQTQPSEDGSVDGSINTISLHRQRTQGCLLPI